MPDSVKEIEENAFGYCNTLLEMVLPKDTVVHEDAFLESPTQVQEK